MSAGSNTCVACESTDVRGILRIPQAPVLCNQLSHSHADALAAPTAAMDLAFCNSCGHVFNSTFDPGLIQYGPDYENSLHFSPRFQAYADELVSALSQRHALASKAVIEVGCGSGDFLRALCDAAESDGYGFDPSVSPSEHGSQRVHLSTDSFFDADPITNAGLLCCRHVLEHVDSPRGFVGAIAEKLRGAEAPAFYLEVPNSLYTLRDLGIWDLIYEHPSYFCAESLSRVVRAAGFTDIEVEETFEGQFLSLHARGSSSPNGTGADASVAEVAVLADRFAQAYESKVGEWRRTLADAATNGRRVAVWGAGSKGNSFLNAVDPKATTVACVVDVNPGKSGKFVAGTGHEIVSPEALRSAPVDLVVLMNPIYEAEVREMLSSVNPNAELLVA